MTFSWLAAKRSVSYKLRNKLWSQLTFHCLWPLQFAKGLIPIPPEHGEKPLSLNLSPVVPCLLSKVLELRSNGSCSGSPLWCVKTNIPTLLLRTRAFSCQPRARCLPIVGASPPCRVRIVEEGKRRETWTKVVDDLVTGNGFVFWDVRV